MDFLILAKQRCTTRGFTKQHISNPDLYLILSAGRVAPHRLQQATTTNYRCSAIGEYS